MPVADGADAASRPPRASWPNGPGGAAGRAPTGVPASPSEQTFRQAGPARPTDRSAGAAAEPAGRARRAPDRLVVGRAGAAA
jgi:hypothetical protein